jgi:hypothetical protein
MKGAVALSFEYCMRRRTLAAYILLTGSVVWSYGHAQSDWQFSDVDRVVAVADIHGAYDAFEQILARAAVIGEDREWTGGATHLVIVGDVLDRGPESRRALDLIMRLEPEARAAGGRVHLVLGNHEVMNLTGDLRYVSAAEFAAFAAEESAELRSAALDRYLATLNGPVDSPAAREAFDLAFPPGFFAHRRAFSPEGVYGSWLLGKPLLLVIGDLAFVHGGLAEAVSANGSNLNAALRQQLNDYVAAVDALTRAGVLAPTDGFYEHAARIAAYRASVAAGTMTWPAGMEAAANRILELQTADLFVPDGPVWYRGNVSCNRLTEQDRLAAALDEVGAHRLVVGHTPTRGAVVLSRMNDSLLRIDTGMLNDYYGGRAAALIIEAGAMSVLYENEAAPARPLAQPRHVGIRPPGLSEDELEAALARAEIESSRDDSNTTRVVLLRDGDLELEGLFTPDERDNIRPAVAAYKLDRLLGLDMVPVAVARTIDGVLGTLQYWPLLAISETERREQDLGGSAWCPLGDQISDMYLFDALIFNEARTAARIRYSTEDFQLLLLGHDRTFSTQRGRPEYLAEQPVDLTPAWRDALSALDETMLTATLGDVLDRRRIRALLERRDLLLESAVSDLRQ